MPDNSRDENGSELIAAVVENSSAHSLGAVGYDAGMIEKLILIDERLPARLAALEMAAGIKFQLGTIAQILTDCKEDQVSEKHYSLYESSRVRVTAFVDAYEPDDMFLRLEASDKNQARYRKLFDELFPEY